MRAEVRSALIFALAIMPGGFAILVIYYALKGLRLTSREAPSIR